MNGELVVGEGGTCGHDMGGGSVKKKGLESCRHPIAPQRGRGGKAKTGTEGVPKENMGGKNGRRDGDCSSTISDKSRFLQGKSGRQPEELAFFGGGLERKKSNDIGVQTQESKLL